MDAAGGGMSSRNVRMLFFLPPVYKELNEEAAALPLRPTHGQVLSCRGA